MKSIIVGITGASGSIYARTLLAHLNASPEVARIDLVISPAGVRVVDRPSAIPGAIEEALRAG